MRRICSLTAALLVVLALFPRPVGAAGTPQPEPARDARREWSFELRETFGQIASALRSVLEKTGCAVDPLGLCAPTPQHDTGCAIDPAGGNCHQ